VSAPTAPARPVAAGESQGILARHEFLIRRLHSLSGLVPVGAYMVVHLLTNLSVVDSPGTFQRNVYMIHSLGKALPFVEWGFIFLPLIFHAVIGVVIIRGGLPNTGSYPLARNWRYTLQRVTGMIALVFILWHVFQMHGWIHADWWLNLIGREKLGDLAGGQFDPYNAATSAAVALAPAAMALLYAVGVLACVYHLANGLWTMGITWGVWISPAAQRRADYVCSGFGVLLAIVGIGALWGMRNVNGPDALQIEDHQYQAKTASGEIQETPEKRSDVKQRELAEKLKY
jgi:succinate dehydrogenase / fumarate reductase cytochrome b subunit